MTVASRGFSRAVAPVWGFSRGMTGSSGSLSCVAKHSHWYITTGKTIALIRWTFVGKVMSLLFKMLSRLVIAFLPRSKCLLISWLQSPATVILEPKKIKSLTVSIVSQSICHEGMDPNAMIVLFWMLSFKPAFSLSSLTFITFIHIFGRLQFGPKRLPWLLPGAELHLCLHLVPPPACRLHYLSSGWTPSPHCRL